MIPQNARQWRIKPTLNFHCCHHTISEIHYSGKYVVLFHNCKPLKNKQISNQQRKRLYIKNYLESRSQISPYSNKNVNKKTSIIAGAPKEH